jgi:hypothetical protein
VFWVTDSVTLLSITNICMFTEVHKIADIWKVTFFLRFLIHVLTYILGGSRWHSC